MFHFIYNPTAGKGKARRFRSAIEAQLKARGVAYCFWETQCRRDAVRIVRDLTRRGERDIVAMGGDGTVNEVLNGLEDPSEVRLGVVPCGSGNDFAGLVGIPRTPEGALEVLLGCEPKPTDYLECSGVRGLNIIGAGLDTDVLKQRSRTKVLRGVANYAVSLLICLLKFDFVRFRAEFNKVKRDCNALIVCACNGRRFGGGFNVCPEARCDDGLLDVVIVELKKPMIPMALLQLLRGKLLEQRYTLHERTEHVRSVFERPTTIQIDGELYDDLPFDVRVVRGGLKMYRA